MDADAWNRRYATSELIWTGEPNRFLVEQVHALPPGRALDLAAGEGRNAVWLARHGWQVTAVDFSDLGLDKAERLAEAAGVQLELILADATQPVDGAFDLVVTLYLQLPAELRRQAHRHAAGAVAPGGTLLVVGHDATNLTKGVGGPQDPAVLFTAAEVVADLDGTGLTVSRSEALSRSVRTTDGEQIAIDALVRAERAT